MEDILWNGIMGLKRMYISLCLGHSLIDSEGKIWDSAEAHFWPPT